MKKTLLAIVVVMIATAVWGATLVNENISTWTNRGSYGNYTQAITAGTVTMTQCMVANAASATGTCSAGRVQMNASSGILQLPALSSVGTAEFRMAAGSTGRSVKLQSYNGATWDDLTTFTGISGTGATYTFDVNSSSSTTLRLASPSHALYVHDIIIADYSSPTPLINLSVGTLSGFTYVYNDGPSSEQTFTVAGVNLTSAISISAPTNYEISKSSGTGFTSPLTFDHTGGVVSTQTVYVRLKSGIAIGNYNGEEITATATNAVNKTVVCSGTVTSPPPPNAPVAIEPTAVSHEGFTARFNTVSGATSYRMDVFVGTGTETQLSEGFEGASTATPPTGWMVSSSGSYILTGASNAYSGTNYAGLNAVNGWVQTPLITNPASLSFWARTSAGSANYTVKVQSSTNGSDWTDVATYTAVPTDAGTITSTYSQKSLSLGLSGSYYLRWFMSARSGGSLYFDDVYIVGGTNAPYVSGWNNKAINSPVVRVSGLNPNTEYSYRVRAVNDYGTGGNSNLIETSTTGASTGVGASTSISGATFTIVVPPLNGFTNNSVEIDPDTATTDDISMEVTVYSSSIKYSFTGNNAALNGLYWINHAGLGYIPINVTVNSGTIVDWMSDANETFVEISDFGAKGTLEITLHDEDTLPVELSSFSAVINAYNKVNLLWVTQTETNLTGFYVYRSDNADIASALQISPLISPTNTSTQQQYIYTDGSLTEDGMYYYWLQVAEMDGSNSLHGPTTVNFSGQSGPGTPSIPLVTEISNIYPNPFNPATTISYSLAATADVSFTIYNSRGQVVRSFDKGIQTANTYKLSWNGKDNYGKECSTGVYFVRMNAGKDSFVRKAVLMK